MSELDFEVFSNVCEQQEVALHPLIAQPEKPNRVCTQFEYHAPSRILQAICIAGILLRDGREMRLANKSIKDIDEEFVGSKAAQVLAGIVNGSIEPATEPFYDLSSAPQGIDVCEAADYNFLQLINRLRENRAQDQIIGNHEPVLIRKTSIGEPRSALSLQDLAVDGIPYPAGSIFGIKLGLDEVPGQISPDGIRSVGLGEIERISFMRLSIFALDEAERRRNFPELTVEKASDANDQDFATLSMPEIALIADEAYARATPLAEYVSAA